MEPGRHLERAHVVARREADSREVGVERLEEVRDARLSDLGGEGRPGEARGEALQDVGTTPSLVVDRAEARTLERDAALLRHADDDGAHLRARATAGLRDPATSAPATSPREPSTGTASRDSSGCGWRLLRLDSAHRSRRWSRSRSSGRSPLPRPRSGLRPRGTRPCRPQQAAPPSPRCGGRPHRRRCPAASRSATVDDRHVRGRRRNGEVRGCPLEELRALARRALRRVGEDEPTLGGDSRPGEGSEHECQDRAADEDRQRGRVRDGIAARGHQPVLAAERERAPRPVGGRVPRSRTPGCPPRRRVRGRPAAAGRERRRSRRG